MSALVSISVSKMLDSVLDTLRTALLTDIDLLPQATCHIVESLRPSQRTEPPSALLFNEIRRFKQRIASAALDYQHGEEYEHYYDYLL
ncbi:hypothetical protein FRC08_011404 [Ceratobasidium sp. 394]|nr:hypothetical protein FRC08_011404 [Ceratobasidium sp. 394]